HRAELVRLLLGGRLVDDDAEAPVAIAHHLGGVGDRGYGEPAHVDSLHLAALDVEHERGVASVFRRAERERRGARTHDVAGASLEIRAIKLPGHIASFSRKRISTRVSQSQRATSWHG